VVIGRENWLFSNTSHGAKASAVIYSIVESAKANNLNPFLYLTFLFEKLPQLTDSTNEQELDNLMPLSKTLPIACRIFKKQV
jgi:transposase